MIRVTLQELPSGKPRVEPFTQKADRLLDEISLGIAYNENLQLTAYMGEVY